MPEPLRFAFVALHVFAAIAWIGGALFLAAVIVPVSRGMQPPEFPSGAGRKLLILVAMRFRRIAWVLLSILVLSGLVVLEGRNLGPGRWTEPGFFSSETGRVLAAKMGLVCVLLALSFIHDFILGPRIASVNESTMPDRPEPASASTLANHQRNRKRLIMLARVNMLIAISVAVLGMMLVRGVP